LVPRDPLAIEPTAVVARPPGRSPCGGRRSASSAPQLGKFEPPWGCRLPALELVKLAPYARAEKKGMRTGARVTQFLRIL